MTEYNESDFLMLSGLQHFAFCKRQWALIHIDRVWEENALTADGRVLHEVVHDAYKSESRSKYFLSRAMPVFSRTLGISGECDMVEFRKSPDGIKIKDKEGLYTLYPVEYKRGKPKTTDEDILQLTAQAMCLEEMFCCDISNGALYYFQTKRRSQVAFTNELRQKVKDCTKEMHSLFQRRYLPKVKPKKGCTGCSLKEICLPKLLKSQSASAYNKMNLGEESVE